MEAKLSEFGAMVSLATDDVMETIDKAIAAEKKLAKLQLELEQIYIILDEPFVVAMDES